MRLGNHFSPKWKQLFGKKRFFLSENNHFEKSHKAENFLKGGPFGLCENLVCCKISKVEGEPFGDVEKLSEKSKNEIFEQWYPNASQNAFKMEWFVEY